MAPGKSRKGKKASVSLSSVPAVTATSPAAPTTPSTSTATVVPPEQPEEADREAKEPARRRAASELPLSSLPSAFSSLPPPPPLVPAFSYLDHQLPYHDTKPIYDKHLYQDKPLYSDKPLFSDKPLYADKPPFSYSDKPLYPDKVAYPDEQEKRPRKASVSQLSQLSQARGHAHRDLSPSRSSSISKESDYAPATPPDNMLFDPLSAFSPAAIPRPKGPMAGSYNMADAESILDGPSPGHSFMNFAPEAFYPPPNSVFSYAVSPHTTPAAPIPAPSTTATTAPPPPAAAAAAATSTSGKSQGESRRRSHPLDPQSDSAAKAEPTHVYRKFERLNQRVLRHLQEELALLEEDLITLDEIEAARLASTSSSSSSRLSPRQKQLAAKYHSLIQDPSILHSKQADLLDKIIRKTDQYNRALNSFSKVLKNLTPAHDEEVDAYRIYLRSPAASSSKVERRMLDSRPDLVLMGPRLPSNPLYSTMAAIFAAILLPLLAFGAISEFFGRIVVVSFVAGAFAWWASNGPPGHDYLVEPQDGWKCAVIYFGFMTVAALLL